MVNLQEMEVTVADLEAAIAWRKEQVSLARAWMVSWLSYAALVVALLLINAAREDWFLVAWYSVLAPMGSGMAASRWYDLSVFKEHYSHAVSLMARLLAARYWVRLQVIEGGK